MIKISFYALLIVGRLSLMSISSACWKIKTSLCHSNEIVFNFFFKQSVAMSFSVLSVLFIKSFSVCFLVVSFLVGCKKMKLYYFYIRTEKYPLKTTTATKKNDTFYGTHFNKVFQLILSLHSNNK